MVKTLRVTLPRIVEVEDYHDFAPLIRNLKKFLDKDLDLCWEEVGFNGRVYVGVIYIMGNKPVRMINKIWAEIFDENYT